MELVFAHFVVVAAAAVVGRRKLEAEDRMEWTGTSPSAVDVWVAILRNKVTQAAADWKEVNP